MQTKHKIQAFTLSEMIVVIILTSIVVGMAFSVLSLVQRHLLGIQDNFNKNAELNRFEQVLWIDFNRYPKIEYYAIDDKLIFTSEIDSVSYKFTTEHTIRDVDTFNISLQHKTLFFNGSTTQNGQIDALKFETSKSYQNQKLFVYKQNDATQFMD